MHNEENGTARGARRSYKKWPWLLLCLLTSTAVAIPFFMLSLRSGKFVAAAQSPALTESRAVGCLGRIEPGDGVVRVSAPYFAGGPALIADLKVKQGDWVRDGQVLAVLASRRQLESAAKQAEARVVVARSRLDQAKQGAKPGDLAAMQSEISRWEAALKTAQAEYKRYEQLRQTGDVSSSELDEKKLAAETTEWNLEAARHRLESLSEIRKPDVATAAAEVNRAVADLNQTRVQLETSVVRAPRAGRILKTYVKAGETVGSEGIVDLADTTRMVVMAEVYETDIGRVRLGQHATISSNLLAGKLDGVVTEVGSQIVKNSLLPGDPVAFADSRVVKVKIEVPDGKALAGLIYGRVDVVIHL